MPEKGKLLNVQCMKVFAQHCHNMLVPPPLLSRLLLVRLSTPTENHRKHKLEKPGLQSKKNKTVRIHTCTTFLSQLWECC